jgi:hypothetical protein
MLSTPPATMAVAPSVMILCAARAMDCSPEMQKRLMPGPGPRFVALTGTRAVRPKAAGVRRLVFFTRR